MIFFNPFSNTAALGGGGGLRQDKKFATLFNASNALGALREKYKLSKWSRKKCKQEDRTKKGPQ